MRYFSDNAGSTGTDFSRFLSALRDRASALERAVRDTDSHRPESFISLPLRPYAQELRTALSPLTRHPLRLAVVIGMGGSLLGARAVYDAVRVSGSPRLLFSEGFDSTVLEDIRDVFLREQVSAEEAVIVIVSRSGSTVETLCGAQGLFHLLEGVLDAPMKRSVFVTARDSALWQDAVSAGAVCVPTAKGAGGRFGVFGPAGLVPLILSGIPAEDFVAGGRRAIRDFLSVSEENPSVHSAHTLFHAAMNGCTVHDTFLFGPRFESLGKWYRQLQAESLGKRGSVAPLLPTVSVGPADLHSMLQFSLAGLEGRLTTFVRGAYDGRVYPSAGVLPLSGLCADSGRVTAALYETVIRSYRQRGLPFTEIHLENTTFDIGVFMQYKMIETVFSATLFGVNPFTQDAVDTYKQEALRRLS